MPYDIIPFDITPTCQFNVQEGIWRNATIEMQARDEECRFLTIDLHELEREIAIIRKQIPIKKDVEEELMKLQVCCCYCVCINTEKIRQIITIQLCNRIFLLKLELFALSV